MFFFLGFVEVEVTKAETILREMFEKADDIDLSIC